MSQFAFEPINDDDDDEMTSWPRHLESMTSYQISDSNNRYFFTKVEQSGHISSRSNLNDRALASPQQQEQKE